MGTAHIAVPHRPCFSCRGAQKIRRMIIVLQPYPPFFENSLLEFPKIYQRILKKGIAFSKIRARIEVHYIRNAYNKHNGGNIMAFKITDACVKCGACADNCPVEAISEGDEKYVIDADVCVSCGACADNCPVEAIEEE